MRSCDASARKVLENQTLVLREEAKTEYGNEKNLWQSTKRVEHQNVVLPLYIR